MNYIDPEIFIAIEKDLFAIEEAIKELTKKIEELAQEKQKKETDI